MRKRFRSSSRPGRSPTKKRRPHGAAGKTVEAKPASKDPVADKPEPDAEPAAAKKLVPPTADEQKRLLGRSTRSTSRVGSRTRRARLPWPANFSTTAERMRPTVASSSCCSAVPVRSRRRRRGEPDAGSGRCDRRGRVHIRPPQVKARFLKQLLTQGSVAGASQVSAVGARCICVKFAEEATAGGAFPGQLLHDAQ